MRSLLLLSMVGLGCGSGERVAGPGAKRVQVLPAVLAPALVSDPVGLVVAAAPEVAYVSLPPGTLPDGETVTIRNSANGAQTATVMATGGWDPIPIPAKAADTLFIAITAKNGSVSEFIYVVPKARRPVIVHTSPLPGKRDIPLNATLLVVFSEPVDPATVTSQSILLLRDGQPVAGRVERSGDGLRVELTPDVALAPTTGYLLRVSSTVADLAGAQLEDDVDVQFTTEAELPPGTGPRIAAGYLMTCALSDAGRAYCWGVERALGIGTGGLEPCIDTFSDGPTNPVEVACVRKPVPVSGGLTFRSLTAGGEHTCGLTTGGQAFCWGGNTRGQLGTGNTSFAATPTPVQGGLVFRTIAAGLAFTCGLTTAGQVYCWGTDGLAGFGTSQQTFHATPELVPGGRIFTSLDAGTNHACALTSDGLAYCWGFNAEGQLGIGNTPLAPCYVNEACAREPLPVAGNLHWKALATGFLRTCGVATDHGVYCWGRPNWPDPRGPSSVPRSIGSGVPDFGFLTQGWQGTSCGITPAGKAWCWGLLIGESSTYSGSPVPLAPELGFAELSVGEGHLCGFTTARELYCWGYNETGAVGVGTQQFHYGLPQLVRLP
jgi:hypothetical protein